jgi:hypothetical protein
MSPGVSLGYKDARLISAVRRLDARMKGHLLCIRRAAMDILHSNDDASPSRSKDPVGSDSTSVEVTECNQVYRESLEQITYLQVKVIGGALVYVRHIPQAV